MVDKLDNLPDHGGVPAPGGPNAPFNDALVRRRKVQFNILIWIVPITVFGWAIGNSMQNTILLTPIDIKLWCTFAGLGAVIGIVPVIATIRLIRAVNGHPIYRQDDLRGLLGMITLSFFCASICAICAAAIGASAWWIANASAFKHSSAPFERVLTPVIEFRSGKGGLEVVVDPYNSGDWIELPISRVDYARGTSAGRPGQSAEFCYPVLVQREGNAVRMLKPRKPRWNEEVLIPCTAQ